MGKGAPQVYTIHMHAFRLLISCVITLAACLSLETQTRSDELPQRNGEVRASATGATAQPLVRESMPSVNRWYINIDAARRAAKGTGMPIMIVFR